MFPVDEKRESVIPNAGNYLVSPLMTCRSERLLLVDDMEPILFAMRDYLSVSGFRVDIAQTRESAIELLDQTGNKELDRIDSDK